MKVDWRWRPWDLAGCGLAVVVAGQEDLGVLPVAGVLRGPVLVQVQLVLRVDDPVLVGIHHLRVRKVKSHWSHLEEILRFTVGNF